MKQCPYCGGELEEEAKFCVECGRSLPEDAPAAEAPAEKKPRARKAKPE